MPIIYIEEKVVVETGTGDIVWGLGMNKPNGEVLNITISQGEQGEVGRHLPELENAKIEDWAVKIYLPTTETWQSLIDVLHEYAVRKGWAEVIEEKKA